ncbi:EVE domain-containing protein [Clostridium sp. CTA-19]
MENNCYMIITTQKDYNIDVENNFNVVGFPERNKNSVKKFKKGDKIIFYLTKKSVFASVVEVTGEYFYDRKQIWNDEYDLWPHRINCKPLYVIKDVNMMVYIKDIWDNLQFIKNKHKWGSQVQGSYRSLSEHDFKIIEDEISKRCNK